MSLRVLRIAMVISLVAAPIWADELLYQYEGDVLPYDDESPWSNRYWIVADACEDPCSESLDDGTFVLQWPHAGNAANYHFWIVDPEPEPPDDPPDSLWVEWQFRSNHPLGPNFIGCDGRMAIRYPASLEVTYMYGDAAISSGGADGVDGLDLDAFHTYRFESLDGVHYRVSVDGFVFRESAQHADPTPYPYMQFSGQGGCLNDEIPDMVNEWDFIRYGTPDEGEEIESTDPPSGRLDPGEYAGLDRFRVTFNEPNYVYIDDVSVDTTERAGLTVIQTRRPPNGDPYTVEIVLNGPLPLDATTTISIDVGTQVRTFEYWFGTPIEVGECGDDMVNQEGEECDGTDDAACPGRCRPDCTCLPPGVIPTVSQWGLVILALLLLSTAKVLFSRRHRPTG